MKPILAVPSLVKHIGQRNVTSLESSWVICFLAKDLDISVELLVYLMSLFRRERNTICVGKMGSTYSRTCI